MPRLFAGSPTRRGGGAFPWTSASACVRPAARSLRFDFRTAQRKAAQKPDPAARPGETPPRAACRKPRGQRQALREWGEAAVGASARAARRPAARQRHPSLRTRFGLGKLSLVITAAGTSRLRRHATRRGVARNQGGTPKRAPQALYTAHRVVDLRVDPTHVQTRQKNETATPKNLFTPFIPPLIYMAMQAASRATRTGRALCKTRITPCAPVQAHRQCKQCRRQSGEETRGRPNKLAISAGRRTGAARRKRRN